VQETVNEIHRAWKTDGVLTVWYRGAGRLPKRKYYISDICRLLGTLEGCGVGIEKARKMIAKSRKDKMPMIPIDHIYAEEMVGRTEIRTQTEEPIQGCVDD